MMSDNLLMMDYSDPEKALQFLGQIKHTRLEGLIIEHEFDQVFTQGFMEVGWDPVDALVLRRFPEGENRSEEFLVLPRPEANHVDQLMEKLRKTGKPVRQLQINYNTGNLETIHDAGGDLLESPQTISIHDEASVRTQQQTHTSVIDTNRIKAVYWGIGFHLGERFGRFIREMVIKDNYISPCSRALWDLDRFFVSPEGKLLFLETKHKYPTRDMKFGMNTGEVQQTDMLIRAGFNAWHLILVKPRLEKGALINVSVF